MISQDFIQQMQQVLLQKKQLLIDELKGLRPHEELGETEEDTAAEFALDEQSQDLITHITDDLARIEKALAKIDAGTYGVDDEGLEFSEAQLKANPYAEKVLVQD